MNTKRRSFLKTLIGGAIGIFAAKKVIPEIKAENYEKTYRERSLEQPWLESGYVNSPLKEGNVICYSGRVTLTGYYFNCSG
jgi:hypothetical protein